VGNLKSLGKILLAMFAVTAMGLFLLAFLVQQFEWGSGGISIGISIVYVIACFLGGYFAGKIQKTKKFIWGILMGLMYVVILLMLTLLTKHGFGASVSAFVLNLLLCLGGGMTGGMLAN
jgi:putative membrane protein (TIGR04086 family)